MTSLRIAVVCCLGVAVVSSFAFAQSGSASPYLAKDGSLAQPLIIRKNQWGHRMGSSSCVAIEANGNWTSTLSHSDQHIEPSTKTGSLNLNELVELAKVLEKYD
ncbi:MAG TPA: hypothetical protein VE988_22730, partial [Gemmataceae bacterium]|nr:hypothetical protein [Gemmataceae bacterium]